MVSRRGLAAAALALLAALAGDRVAPAGARGTGVGGGDGMDGADDAAAATCGPALGDRALWNGVAMPRVGFGTAGMRGRLTEKAVKLALEAGFRHFDGAEATEWYDDAAMGRAIAAYMREHPELQREDLFLATKVHPKNLGSNRTRAAVEAMLQRLQTEYLDLVMLHYPRCGDWIPDCRGVEAEGDWLEAYAALEEFYEAGKVRALGLSNVGRYEISETMSASRVHPHVVQNWMDPFHQDAAVRADCEQHKIAYTSYSTLGGQWEHRAPYKRNLVTTSETLGEIAARTGKSVQEVALLWGLQRDATVLPRSTTAAHIAANAALLALDDDALLSNEDLLRIDALALE